MDSTLNLILGGLGGVVLGGLALLGIMKTMGRGIVSQAKTDAQRIADQARLEAQTHAKQIELEAQKAAIAAREQADRDAESQRRELRALDDRLAKREETLDRKLDTLTVKERNIDDLERRISKRDVVLTGKEKELEDTLSEQKAKLLTVAGMTQDQAVKNLMAQLEEECKKEAGDTILRVTEHAQDEAKEKSRQIILQAIQKYASSQTADHTVSTVQIPTDDMKGRVIGREGRNIRAFEKSTGVDVIIDDTPGVVVVSCFDPVRREIARISLERLTQDGRIHPARIEEVVEATTKEMEENLLKIGKEAAAEANFANLPKGVIPMLGRLGFRTSYGQNVLRHSMEVAYLSQTIAEELGLDGMIARRAGLLHDIGKAMDHEQEGGHPQLGKAFLQKFGEREEVLNAAEGHHGDVPPTTPYTVIIMAADAISASRPGARRESLEKYVKRLQDLEALAMEFDGVRQAYAIQAGREVRVIVDAQKVDDKVGAKIARDIAKKIEEKMTYPGEIKVTLIRETRAVEYAR